jgi:endonuclease YncB( thermonuclease family)
VLEKDNVLKIRLRGIDCPEKGQAFGKQAKLLTAQLAFGKTVTIKEQGQDRYGRMIADVILPDKTSLSCDLVKAGYAWWYRRYAPDDVQLAALESEARAKHIGIWSVASATPPWQFRQQRSHEARPKTSTNSSILSAVLRKAYVH